MLRCQYYPPAAQELDKGQTTAQYVTSMAFLSERPEAFTGVQRPDKHIPERNWTDALATGLPVTSNGVLQRMLYNRSAFVPLRRDIDVIPEEAYFEGNTRVTLDKALEESAPGQRPYDPKFESLCRNK